MKEIQLLCGKKAFVDDCDFEKLQEYRWKSRSRGTTTFYAEAKGSRLSMHRIIINAKKGEQVDHINRNGLDNRRENLRLCSHSQNQINRPQQKNNTSGYKGVYLFKKKWRACIKIKGKLLYLGYFSDKKEAAETYNKKAKELFGEFAYQNPV